MITRNGFFAIVRLDAKERLKVGKFAVRVKRRMSKLFIMFFGGFGFIGILFITYTRSDKLDMIMGIEAFIAMIMGCCYYDVNDFMCGLLIILSTIIIFYLMLFTPKYGEVPLKEIKKNRTSGETANEY